MGKCWCFSNKDKNKMEMKNKENKDEDINFGIDNIDFKSNDDLYYEWINERGITESKNINTYENDDNPPYDLVVDIKSIYELNKGWKIYHYGKKANISRTKNYDPKEKYIISVIGNANRGKTFLLRLLSAFEQLKEVSKNSITTLGLSMKFPKEKEFILLDTVGFNAPLLIDENNEKKDIRDLSGDKFNKIIHTITRGQIITNYLLQNFIINEADIVICLIAQLNFSEQIFLNQIRTQCEGKKSLYVVHNLMHLKVKDEIEKYLEETLLKSYTFDLEKIKIPKFEEDDSFSYYFREKSQSNNQNINKDVLHFILGNEEKPELKYYNKTTIEYLKDIIQTNFSSEHKKILNSLKDYIQETSGEIFKNPLNSIHLSDKEIKCEVEKLQTKDIAINELEKVTFIEEKFKPQYRYYVMANDLYIEILVCSKTELIECNFEYINDSVNFIIKAIKLKDTPKEKTKVFLERRKYGEFEIKFSMDLNEYNIKSIIEEREQSIKKGIIRIKYPIEPFNKNGYNKKEIRVTDEKEII